MTKRDTIVKEVKGRSSVRARRKSRLTFFLFVQVC